MDNLLQALADSSTDAGGSVIISCGFKGELTGASGSSCVFLNNLLIRFMGFSFLNDSFPFIIETPVQSARFISAKNCFFSVPFLKKERKTLVNVDLSRFFLR